MSGGFQRLYDENVGVRVGLGCPQAREIAGDGSQQYFERGGLLWWSDRNRDDLQDHILVLYGLDSGAYENLTPEQVTALGPDPTPGPDPSQPQRGFGRVYFLKPGTRELLGAWTSPEIELEGGRRAVVQAFASGLMFWTPDYRPTGRPSIFVLYGNGTFERFDDTNAG